MYQIQNIYLENYSVEKVRAMLHSLNCNYYAILHDRDIKPNGEVKKAHFHIVVDYNDNTHHTKENLVKLLLEQGFTDKCMRIESCKNVTKSLRYLTHEDNAEKFHYSIEDCFTNDLEGLQEFRVIQVKIKENDRMLEEFAQCIEKGEILGGREIMKWFRDRQKLDYYMKNIQRINTLYQMLVETFN